MRGIRAAVRNREAKVTHLVCPPRGACACYYTPFLSAFTSLLLALDFSRLANHAVQSLVFLWGLTCHAQGSALCSKNVTSNNYRGISYTM